ncbi:MAG TPA: dienelactone hydrolase family protein [Nitrospiraceae bacterium]
MTSSLAPFTLDQIGTDTARFPSGVAIPTATDGSVDPYFRTRISKDVQVECVQFWPQEKGTYPGLVLIHEWWGLNSQIKDLGARLACEGYGVIIPNLYARLGGMVTANADIAEMLMGRLNNDLTLQDINSCCEFLNTRDFIKRNIHGVVGFGMGGSFALQFACRRKRLRAAVSFYGRMVQPATAFNDVRCPVLYHQGGQDVWATAQEADMLRSAATQYGKQVEIKVYPDAPHAFCNEMRPDIYRAEAAADAWNATAAFLKQCFQGT